MSETLVYRLKYEYLKKHIYLIINKKLTPDPSKE
jgi:hypothetical protein